MQTFEALIDNNSGDVVFKIEGETYFDFDNLWAEIADYDVVLEDYETTLVTGLLTDKQYQRLKK